MEDLNQDEEAKSTNINSLTEEENKQWIKETSLKSWEPELLISGVAIYLTLSLPEFLRWLYDFYIYNFVLDPENKVIPLTNLIYALLNSIAYLLSITFVIHFALRAFWVGLVGLHSVYPDGILYDKITNYGTYYLSQLEKKLGKMEEFIIRLDQVCSVFFSLSFMLVVLLLGICWMYLIILLVIGMFQLFLPEEIYKSYELSIYFSLFTLILAYATLVSLLNLKVFRDHPTYKIWHFKLSWYLGISTFPVIYKPMSFILFIFLSHTSRKKLIIYGLILFVAFFYAILTSSLTKDRLNRLFETRDFYTTHSEAHLMQAKHYDNLLQDDARVMTLSIQSEVIKENYLKLFLAYPRSLDLWLKAHCQKPNIADTLDKFQKRALKAQHSLNCIKNFFKIYIDDSLYASQDFVFYENTQPNKKGVLTFVPIENLKTGQHILKIAPAKPDKTLEKEHLYAIPFWYLPE